jgi:hypothetical protein
MVHLAQNSNEDSPVSGAVHDEFARSVKVVAGARNHLNLLFNAPRLEAPFGWSGPEPPLPNTN